MSNSASTYFPPTTLDESLFVMLHNIPETRDIVRPQIAALKMAPLPHEELHATVREKYDALRNDYYRRVGKWPDLPTIYKFMIELYQSEAVKHGIFTRKVEVRLADPNLADVFVKTRDEV